jgi:small neutral amino acid transporter SnatA (MarC family)
MIISDNTNKIIYTFFVFIILFFGVLTLNYLEILEMNLYTIISGITVFIVAICYIWKIMKDTENAITLGTKIGQLILLCYNSFKEVKT